MERVAVIGGGISGLAAAHRLIELAQSADAPIRVSLFEAGPRLGGVIETRRIDDSVVELGADSFITNKPCAIRLCERLGIEDRLVFTDPRYRRTLVLRNGKPMPVPEGFVLLAPTKFWPIVTSPLFSPLGKLRMGLEWLVPGRREGADESVGSFVRRRWGREALERLMQPLVGGIYTADPDQLSLQATLPRFLEMERLRGSLLRAARREGQSVHHAAASGAQTSDTEPHESGARYGLFVSFQNGMSELVDALVRRLQSAAEIHLDARVDSLARLGGVRKGYSLSFAASAEAPAETATFDAVILALPAERATEVLQPVDPSLAAALAEIEYASSAIVCTSHSAADIAYPLDASGLVVPATEKRRILSVSFASRKFARTSPEDRVVLRSFVGGALQPEVLANSDDELVQIVLSELHEILGVRGKPRFAVVSRHMRAMPQYKVGHLDRVRAIENLLAAQERLALGGNAYSGVGIPDCIKSGELAAERVFGSLKSRQAGGLGILPQDAGRR